VLDTNVLLSHSAFLRELKDTPMRGVGRPVLVLPWVVMQELDSLKTSGKVKLSTAAGTAIKWLHDCFSSTHPRVKGQTMEEVGVVRWNLRRNGICWVWSVVQGVVLVLVLGSEINGFLIGVEQICDPNRLTMEIISCCRLKLIS